MKLFGIFLVCLVVFGVSTQGREEESNEISIVMVGDALLHKSVYEDARAVAQKSTDSKDSKNFDFTPMLQHIAPLVEDYDLRFYNQETILGGESLGLSSYPTFNSPQEFGDCMLNLGFNLVSLANNHTLDKGEKGVRAMLEYWNKKRAENKDLLTAGSFESADSRAKIEVREKNGIKYALLAYTYGTNGIPLPQGKEYLVNVYTKEMLKHDIAQVREKVDLLIVSMHWGVEYEFVPNKEQRELARFLSKQGVNLIIGTHPHVLQTIEKIDDTLVIYSLGNFLSGQKDISTRIGALVSLKAHKDSKQKITFSDIRAELIYTKSNNWREFVLYPFSLLNEAILPDYKALQAQYMGILQNGGVIKE